MDNIKELAAAWWWSIKMMSWWMLVCVCSLSLQGVWGSQELIMNLSKGFAAGLEDCKKELNTGDHILQDFVNYWREEYDLVNRELGCMIICLGQKLGLIDADMKMHHGNANEFAQKHGADEEKAKQLVALVHECEKTHEGVEEACQRFLEMAKCFRTKIHELKWAPSMSVVMEEMLNAL